MNAALALKVAPPGATGEAMQHLVEDANVRVRLIAASSLLAADPGNAKAGAVLAEALRDPAPRVRNAALELVGDLGTGGAAYLEVLKKCHELEGEAESRDVVARLIERLEIPGQDGSLPQRPDTPGVHQGPGSLPVEISRTSGHGE
jgi:HEAT repeat associated with sister chromatid cohesion